MSSVDHGVNLCVNLAGPWGAPIFGQTLLWMDFE